MPSLTSQNAIIQLTLLCEQLFILFFSSQSYLLLKLSIRCLHHDLLPIAGGGSVLLHVTTLQDFPLPVVRKRKKKFWHQWFLWIRQGNQSM